MLRKKFLSAIIIYIYIILLYNAPHPLPLPQASPEAMAAVVLAEVPGQLTEYMRKNGIAPKGRPQ